VQYVAFLGLIDAMPVINWVDFVCLINLAHR
jgi:hypothetical protein